jgi:hypothetical protein
MEVLVTILAGRVFDADHHVFRASDLCAPAGRE